MKLTLQDTDTQPGEHSRKVTVEFSSDLLTIDQVWKELIRPALLAMTFPESTVDGFVEYDDSEEYFTDSLFDQTL